MIHIGKINNDSQSELSLELVKFELSDYELLTNFIFEQYKQITNKEFFILDDIDTALPLILNNNGIVYGALYNDEIVAIQAIDFSIENHSNLKPFLAKYFRDSVFVEMGWTMTKIGFQNKGIATSLIKQLEEAILDNLKNTVLVTTIHPSNIKALKTYLHSGYLGYTHETYYGLPRIFLLKYFNRLDKKNLTIKINTSDTECIKRAFENGFMLSDIAQEEKIIYFVYQK